MGKASPRVEAYGTVDELSSSIGLLRCEDLPEEISARLNEVQQALFAIGAALADPEERMEHPSGPWDAEPLEEWIDAMDSQLEPLSAFILPGGCRSAALSHVTRTTCRRAERRVLVLEEGPAGAPSGVVPYLNRLSDVFFVLARFLNQRMSVAEIQWRPNSRK